MNISLENVDKVNALLTIKLEKTDYEEKVNTALKDFRKKANIPGFRPGQVPMGLLKKRFGSEVLAEQINKILSEEVYKYIREQKINILGEPLPNEEKTPKMDFETQEEFTFAFDVALAPEFDGKISKKDKLTYYTIKVDDAMIDQQVQAYAQRGGQYNKVEEYQDNDMVKGLLAELDENGNVLEGGVQVENAVMLPNYMKNDDEKAKFQGAKVNDVIVFNPANAYNNSEVELASLLKLDKSVAAEKKGDFSFQVEEITRYEPAPVNQELFDRMLGEGVVKSEEEFREYIKKNMETQFVADSEYKFMLDLRAYLTDRIGEVEFPEAILKRIMKLNKPDDEEYVEKNFEGSLKELLWHLIKEQLSDQLQIKVEQADVMEAAKEATRMQFAQYGMMNIPDESLEQYATEMLKNKEQAEGLVSRTVENKIAKAAQEVLTLKKKEVSLEEFNNLFQSEKTA
ncbi:MAG: trigger factor [Bacteroidaceae bacterium]|nr:trigger factor [Bacteroidaceae bacterium]MBR6047816.1 trigger factor [Bacteroidaceae bacterium]